MSAGAVSGSARRRGRPPEGRTWHGANFLHPEPRRPGSIAMELDQTLERVHPSASGDDQRATGWRGTRAVLAWSPARPPPPSLPRPPPGTTRMPIPEAIERSPRHSTLVTHPRANVAFTRRHNRIYRPLAGDQVLATDSFATRTTWLASAEVLAIAVATNASTCGWRAGSRARQGPVQPRDPSSPRCGPAVRGNGFDSRSEHNRLRHGSGRRWERGRHVRLAYSAFSDQTASRCRAPMGRGGQTRLAHSAFSDQGGVPAAEHQR